MGWFNWLWVRTALIWGTFTPFALAITQSAPGTAPSCGEWISVHEVITRALPELEESDIVVLWQEATTHKRREAILKFGEEAQVFNLLDALLERAARYARPVLAEITRKKRPEPPSELSSAISAHNPALSEGQRAFVIKAIYQLFQRDDEITATTIRQEIQALIFERLIAEIDLNHLEAEEVSRGVVAADRYFSERLELTAEQDQILYTLFTRNSYKPLKYWQSFMDRLGSGPPSIRKSMIHNLLVLASGERAPHSKFCRDGIFELAPKGPARVWYFNAADGTPMLVIGETDVKSGSNFRTCRQDACIDEVEKVARDYYLRR